MVVKVAAVWAVRRAYHHGHARSEKTVTEMCFDEAAFGAVDMAADLMVLLKVKATKVKEINA